MDISPSFSCMVFLTKGEHMNYTEQKSLCMKTGRFRTDSNKHFAFSPNLCGIITHTDCLPHRIIEQTKDFAYLNSEDINLKILEEIGMNSGMDINYGFVHLNITRDNIEEQYPDLWFRVLLTSKHIVVAVRKEDKNKFKGHGVSFEQMIREYVDWTHLEGNFEAEAFLLETMKSRKRILGKGEKPANDTNPKRYCTSMKKHALRTKTELMSMEEIRRRKIPEIVYEPAHVLTFAVKTENGMKEMKFSEFLRYRIDGRYADEWKEYLGEFEEESMQEYLRWLYKTNEEYDFLSVIFKK